MKIKILSDTHKHHVEERLVPVEMLIHAGDATDHWDPILNQHEFLDFWTWWDNYPAKYKIFIPGNHDSWLESPLSKNFRENLPENHWILIDKTIEIEGIKIFGSPYTPEFGKWAFNVDRGKIHKHWKLIEEGTDIVITHGPPKYILDLSRNRQGKLEFCGDSSLGKRLKIIKPKYHFFGHIHGNKEFENNGILERNKTIYINCTQMKDNMFEFGMQYSGKIIDYINIKK